MGFVKSKVQEGFQTPWSLPFGINYLFVANWDSQFLSLGKTSLLHIFLKKKKKKFFSCLTSGQGNPMKDCLNCLGFTPMWGVICNQHCSEELHLLLP